LSDAASTPEGTAATHDATAEQAVPYPRFAKVNAERKALADQNEALQGQLAAHRAAADELAALRAERSTWAEERELMGQGLTDEEGISLVRHYYGRLPAESRPKSLGEYVASLRVEGAAVPKGLAPFVGAVAAPVAESPQARTMPRSTATGVAAPAAPTVTAEALRAAREQAQRSGNWEPVKALQLAYGQQRR
jgi:hypothetical protein